MLLQIKIHQVLDSNRDEPDVILTNDHINKIRGNQPK